VRRFVVGVTGASGSICARSVLRELVAHPGVEKVHLVLSRFAITTLNVELRARARDEAGALRALLGGARRGLRSPKIILHRPDEMTAAISSGSYRTDGMVIVPCSGGTLAAVAGGTVANLLQRAAEVTLKEGRPLVLAFRESPLSRTHIENMRRASRSGAVLYPLIPAFYTRPRTMDEIVDQFTARIFDLLRLPHSLGKRWGPSR
jgi:4-hydroxy-3-polyprenylbenzoate decarboxylase